MKIETLNETMIPFPNKKYEVIYADPPWSYRDKALAVNMKHNQSSGLKAYQLMI